LPMLQWLPSEPFEQGWAVAARVDPVRVLPFMQWCLGAWSLSGPLRGEGRPQLRVGSLRYDGNWNPRAPDEWFGLRTIGNGKWARVRCTPHIETSPGEFTQSLDREGVELVHVCAHRECTTPRQFQRRPGPSWVVDVDVEWLPYRVIVWNGSRASYGEMWAADLFEMPLLSCPKDWELT
jgi:hypothetical protein